MVESPLILLITPGLNISESTASSCCKQLTDKLAAGFHNELGKSPQVYLSEYAQAVLDVAGRNPTPQDLVALVEPRIPFRRQLELLKVALDPAVYAFPKQPVADRPYGVVLKVVDRTFPEIGGLRLGGMVEGLPPDLRAATPFEGINGDMEEIVRRSFVAMPGGEVCPTSGFQTGLNGRFSIPCLETYLGQPRVSYIHPSSSDGLVGVLAAIR
ncbi:hypothetical protein HYS93_03900 [Candidatus Daviesbacteria bacterium]|nr:hypothetical protein [Candidatus Daviesbacteria bacterium]